MIAGEAEIRSNYLDKKQKSTEISPNAFAPNHNKNQLNQSMLFLY
jgi:hypothetical protein